ncbi:hypothetical protein Tco_1069325 [Tanacetum coccineum]|uniref:Zinc finger, CCHC-type n=1 Tax=Tanacetum coccineum TaxID=301880 RepID=A0ABQ5HKF2_9ASTR
MVERVLPGQGQRADPLAPRSAGGGRGAPLVEVWGQRPKRGSGQRPYPNGIFGAPRNTVKEMTTNFRKLDKFEGHDFRRWQKKMHFLLKTCVDNTDAGIDERFNSGSNKDKGKVGER